MVANWDMAAMHSTVRGTNTQPRMELPATGKKGLKFLE